MKTTMETVEKLTSNKRFNDVHFSVVIPIIEVK